MDWQTTQDVPCHCLKVAGMDSGILITSKGIKQVSKIDGWRVVTIAESVINNMRTLLLEIFVQIFLLEYPITIFFLSAFF